VTCLSLAEKRWENVGRANMAENKSKMHLALFAIGTGHHVSGWRMPGAEAGALDFQFFRQIAETAERGKFDMFFLADALNAATSQHPSYIVRFEPLTLLSALTTVTSRIGLAATAITTYTEPYNLARYFASIDHLSGGRAAWNVVTGAFPEAAENFGKVPHPDHSARYAMADEFVKVVKGLWDSWEDGAVVADKQTGRYLDTSKLHVLDHDGPHYRVKGPLNSARPPQGHPVIIQAGASDTGRDFAARVAEVVFAVQQDLETAKAFREDLRARAESAGRDPNSLKVLPGVSPIVADTEEEALAQIEKLSQFADPVTALRVLSERIGHDLSSHSLDEPVPSFPPSDKMQGHAVNLARMSKKHNLTLRQLRDYASAAQGHRLIWGTPQRIADQLQEWFDADAADGFVVMPAYFPGALDAFVDRVIPILQKRGLFRTEYESTTLRGHLGLSRPIHAAAAPFDARLETARG
jgi:N-acetyl-S-(2-succino)cysteine monooxygenase